MLLANPHPPRLEIINDKNGFVTNFWRAVKHSPELTAEFADWPVLESEIHARHKYLREVSDDLHEKLEADVNYYDPMIAGYWVHGLAAWIGGTWCNTPNQYRQKPHMSGFQGVHRSEGGSSCDERRAWLSQYFKQLQDRLRNVKVLTGDWKRCIPGFIERSDKPVGIFLDPPYLYEVGDYTRDDKCYGKFDSGDVAREVHAWAVDIAAKNSNIRICLCGYEGEHVIPDTWETVEWKSSGAMSSYAKGENISEEQASRKNAKRERLWFANCLTSKVRLF